MSFALLGNIQHATGQCSNSVITAQHRIYSYLCGINVCWCMSFTWFDNIQNS